MTTSPLLPYIAQHYAQVKGHHPTEGRRRWRLRVAQRFWTTVASGTSEDLLHHLGHVIMSAAHTGESNTDPDPLDGVSRDTPELGLLIRTDFSDERAWEAFCARLQDSERKAEPEGGDDADEDASEQGPPFDNMDEEDDSNYDSDEEDAENAPIFRIINPSFPEERALLTDASNLTALRLFNDVDVRRSPPLLRNVKHIYPPNRLVDHHGWQEIYQGKNVWIYDAMSNIDQCVRVVSQSGDMYGTGDLASTGVAHMRTPGQLVYGALKIDFGGVDRWDFNERRRNMTEAEGE
ncbi:hypothetical protein JVU11DRAFT_2756 [Chiua virens]|nr:hypothetical protein JVU11DRAFT_2756 [Chiua virens]